MALRLRAKWSSSSRTARCGGCARGSSGPEGHGAQVDECHVERGMVADVLCYARVPAGGGQWVGVEGALGTSAAGSGE